MDQKTRVLWAKTDRHGEVEVEFKFTKLGNPEHYQEIVMALGQTFMTAVFNEEVRNKIMQELTEKELGNEKS